MPESTICQECGAELSSGASICAQCGWDSTLDLARPKSPSLMAQLRAGGWRVVVYGLILALPLVGFSRLRATGPGEDLPTTLRYMVFGDAGRADELKTIHRMHEIGSAAARYSIREEEQAPFDGDWATVLAPSATARVRGWIPLVFFGSDTGMSPDSVRDMYEIKDTDGWGRPYRVTVHPVLGNGQFLEDPLVRSDLEEGLQATFYTRDVPELEYGTWIRLLVESAGRDGKWDSDDDLRMVSYVQTGHVYRMLYDPQLVQNKIEREYTIGRHYYRIEGSEWDLIDARLLAEFRLTSIH
jgi:hypothetical protein